MRRRLAVSLGALLMLAICGKALAGPPIPEVGGVAPLGSEVQRLHFKYGPVPITPGDNFIMLGPVTIEKPLYDGYMTRIKPDLVRADGSVPDVDVIHLHHGVWLNQSRDDSTDPGFPERFFAAGEEKTIGQLPEGYGYPVKGTDVWLMNYMIHNQTPIPETVWITYTVDYVPADSDLGRSMEPARPIWMDVENGEAYPVFDVLKGSGSNGTYTYPDDHPNPYGGGPRKNEWTVDRDGTLIAMGGHVHPGGLHTDFEVSRSGHPDPALIYRSEAEYFDPLGPVSWDMAMKYTPPDYRVTVREGDRLRIGATYDTTRASWYESMGIMIAYMSDETNGLDPFADSGSIPKTGEVTHGHLPENENYGGGETGSPDPVQLPDGTSPFGQVGIAAFAYVPGEPRLPEGLRNPPVVGAGESLQFDNFDAAGGIYHTITSCKPPCNRSTGISYPLADSDVIFDSGELGYGPDPTQIPGNPLPGGSFTPAANRATWQTPPDLEPGTYTFFCRIHPSMRGAFRVKP